MKFLGDNRRFCSSYILKKSPSHPLYISSFALCYCLHTISSLTCIVTIKCRGLINVFVQKEQINDWFNFAIFFAKIAFRDIFVT